jgi:5-(carboxyamino)imidazole ribonucleotide synthase
MVVNFASQKFKLGILGGGQLGRMLIQEAMNLNLSTAVMDPDANAPCRFITETFIHADFQNEASVYEFGKQVDLLTVEIEHVNVRALLRLEAEGLQIYPQPLILQMVQDKGVQKAFFLSHNIPTAPFHFIENKNDLLQHVERLPAILKLRTSGYDGKGVMKLDGEESIKDAFDAPCILEELIDFDKEISVIVARNNSGEIANFPVVEMEFNTKVNLVEFLCSPARITIQQEEEAIQIAKNVIEKTGMVGVLAVEMFVTKAGKILVNEIAPRPHNSGHHTIEGNVTSQYAQHLRAILGLPLGDTSIVKPSVMINLLGEPGFTGEAKYEGMEQVMELPGTHIHLYGKKITKPFRKMGHITVTANRLNDAIEIAEKARKIIRVIC